MTDELKPGTKCRINIPKNLYFDLCNDPPDDGVWALTEDIRRSRPKALVAEYELKGFVLPQEETND